MVRLGTATANTNVVDFNGAKANGTRICIPLRRPSAPRYPFFGGCVPNRSANVGSFKAFGWISMKVETLLSRIRVTRVVDWHRPILSKVLSSMAKLARVDVQIHVVLLREVLLREGGVKKAPVNFKPEVRFYPNNPEKGYILRQEIWDKGECKKLARALENPGDTFDVDIVREIIRQYSEVSHL